MSASLVGSEMCIRDRHPWDGRSAPWDVADGVAIPQHQSASGVFPRSKGPVSYTHLTLPTICSV
eukprot:14508933-Alexandrium_andersonii.AAC.1